MAITITIYSAYHINTHTNHAVILPKIYQKTFHHMASASNKNIFKKKVCHSAICCTRFFHFGSAAPQRKALPRRPNQSILHYLPQGNGPNFVGRRVPQKCWQYIILILFLTCAYEFFHIINIFKMMVFHMYNFMYCRYRIWFYIWFYLIPGKYVNTVVNIKHFMLSIHPPGCHPSAVLLPLCLLHDLGVAQSHAPHDRPSSWLPPGLWVVSILVEYWDKSSWPEKMCWKATEDVLKSVKNENAQLFVIRIILKKH